MAEKDTIFSSTVKYNGIVNFSDFYKFCYEWLAEEEGFNIAEDEYVEKIKGDSKDISVEWTGTKKVTDYFKFEIKVSIEANGLTKVDVTTSDGKKISTNKGGIKVKVKAILVRDYDGKFETTPFKKFIRAIYEKWIIASRIDEMEGNLVGKADGFLSQAKAYLDLEGKK